MGHRADGLGELGHSQAPVAGLRRLQRLVAFNKALVPMCAALVLAVAQVQGGQTVPRDPPFVFLWHAKEQTSDSPRRVIAALWPDGRWLQASDLRGADNLYKAGRLGTEELQKIVCEIEAID